MADKSGRLVLHALTRAAADPGGSPLFASRSASGLFPATPVGRAAAQKCRDEGWLAGDDENTPATLTDKGMAHLLAESSPREVLEDFVRVIESREGQVKSLLDTAHAMQSSLVSLKGTLASVLSRIAPGSDNRLARAFHARHPVGPLAEAVVAALLARRGAGDCPLPELYRLVATDAAVSLGAFHDALRALHAEECVRLYPWTGPLHEMPSPQFALLVGHDVAYYAGPRVGA